MRTLFGFLNLKISSDNERAGGLSGDEPGCSGVFPADTSTKY